MYILKDDGPACIISLVDNSRTVELTGLVCLNVKGLGFSGSDFGWIILIGLWFGFRIALGLGIFRYGRHRDRVCVGV